MTPHVENTLEKKKKVGKSVNGSHVYCVSGACDQSATTVSFTVHVKKGFICSQEHRGARSVTAQKCSNSNNGALIFLLFP